MRQKDISVHKNFPWESQEVNFWSKQFVVESFMEKYKYIRVK